MKYGVFSSSTNKLIRHGICPADLLSQQAKNGEYAVEIVGTSIDPTKLYTRNPDTGALTTEDHMDFIRQMASDALSQICGDIIIGGFTCDVIMAGTIYPTSLVDQANMLQATAVGGKLMTCLGDTWTLQEHTVEQAQQVLTAFVTFKDAARQNLATKLALIQAATTQAAVMAITW